MSGKLQYLLDTNILSETRKKQADKRVLAFLSTAEPSALFISVLTLGELKKGVAVKKKSDPDGAALIAAWVDGLEASFGDRILDVDVAAAKVWGDLSAERPRPVVDTLLAATAMTRDLTFVTRNTEDVQGIQVNVLNPWNESKGRPSR
jgi:toxin FitB